MVAVMQPDDEIDEIAFLLGSPTEAEVLRQHNRLIEAELAIVQGELSKARRDITRLVDLHQTAADELAKLRVAHEALQKDRNSLYIDYVQLDNKLKYAPIGKCPISEPRCLNMRERYCSEE